MFTATGWLLIAIMTGALIYLYIAGRDNKKKLAETKAKLVSMKSFLDELTKNDIELQRELIASNTELNRRIFQLSTLLEAAKELLVVRDPKDLLDRIPLVIKSLIPSQGVGIRTLNEDKTCLVLVSYVGLPREYVENNKCVPIDSSPFSQIIKEDRSLSGLSDCEMPGFSRESAGFDKLTFILSMPIIVKAKITGVLDVYTPNLYDRTSEDIQLLTILAAYASTALENAKLYEELGSAYYELSMLKEYNESILESVTLGLAAINICFTVTTWNPGMESITGIPREAAIGHKCFELLKFHEEPDISDLLIKVFEDGRTYDFNKLKYTTPNGRDRIVSLRACPLILPDKGSRDKEDFPYVPSPGKHSGAIIVMQDITSTIRLEEQLRWAEKMKAVGEFSAGIAHEINNPIGIISACAEHLGKKLEKRRLPDDFLRLLGVIEEEAERCSSIITNLMVFSRRRELNLEITDIGHVVLEVVKILQAQAMESKVSLSSNYKEDETTKFLVLADKAQIRQVFINLALNAIQAMPGGGSLKIDISCQPEIKTCNNIKIRFTDTGHGISEEDLKKIFIPFFTTRSGGVGLGLAVSHGIVKGHGGTLTVRSKEGVGTSFIVNLPYYNATAYGSA